MVGELVQRVHGSGMLSRNSGPTGRLPHAALGEKPGLQQSVVLAALHRENQ